MGGKAPSVPDGIGDAAMLSAKTGREMLAYMRQSGNQMRRWAEQDRAYYKDTFRPLERQMANDARTWDSSARRGLRANEAAGDVRLAAQQGTEQRERQAMAMGVDPRSGRYRSAEAKAGTDTALAVAGARNMARRQVEQEGQALRANAVNLGQGMAVNPGTMMGAGTTAGGAGFQGAMQGYGQQGHLLNADYQARLEAYGQRQQGLGGFLGGVGSIAGAFMSSKDYKTDKAPVDALGAVRQMPVEAWTYKPGIADGGRHVGPYAEDFHKVTGVGDGKSIDPMTQIGLTMGAVQQLAEKVDRLAKRKAA